MAEQLANNAATTLNGAINSAVTSLVVTNGTVFPASGNFRIIIDSELMLCTARATNTLTVTRAIESTSAASHSNGAAVTHVLTAAGLDTYIDEQVAIAIAAISSTFKGARVYHNANQSISNATATALAFNSERYDTDTMHDTVTNNSRLTATTAGKYLITGHLAFAGAAGGTYRTVDIRLNGTTVIANQHLQFTGVSQCNGSVATVYDMAASDYVQLMCYQDSGGSLNAIVSANTACEFTASRLG